MCYLSLKTNISSFKVYLALEGTVQDRSNSEHRILLKILNKHM